MFERSKQRYVTKGVEKELSKEIQDILWNWIEEQSENGRVLDYFQVFHIRPNGKEVKIINKQEVPPMTKEMIFQVSIPLAKEYTVWLIDDIEYCIMLFPEEY
ncbi:DUF960 family protein [Geobacillus stearothermophilus]|uniref:DUF960 family protein n=1 Tax=Geobacillus stearothermophilus TaxID=1422 RepID=UPI003D1C00E1